MGETDHGCIENSIAHLSKNVQCALALGVAAALQLLDNFGVLLLGDRNTCRRGGDLGEDCDWSQ
jgi:hypothetical protein